MGLFAVLFINYSRYAPWSEHDSGIIDYSVFGESYIKGMSKQKKLELLCTGAFDLIITDWSVSKPAYSRESFYVCRNSIAELLKVNGSLIVTGANLVKREDLVWLDPALAISNKRNELFGTTVYVTEGESSITRGKNVKKINTKKYPYWQAYLESAPPHANVISAFYDLCNGIKYTDETGTTRCDTYFKGAEKDYSSQGEVLVVTRIN
ncbi:MAG: hypothetical protein LBQ43_02595 [Holosporales bacterium]|jgi:hypothetical protein|nr:hypothetical protein [Holosporales bacterium]